MKQWTISSMIDIQQCDWSIFWSYDVLVCWLPWSNADRLTPAYPRPMVLPSTTPSWCLPHTTYGGPQGSRTITSSRLWVWRAAVTLYVRYGVSKKGDIDWWISWWARKTGGAETATDSRDLIGQWASHMYDDMRKIELGYYYHLSRNTDHIRWIVGIDCLVAKE